MLTVVRHGPTKFNGQSGTGDTSTDRIRGWADIPLSPEGVQIAKGVGKSFKGLPVKHIYTSDLSRAKETADQIEKHTHAPMTVDKSFRPWGLGSFSGQKVSDVQPKIDKLMKNPDEPAPDGESLNDFLSRFIKAVWPLLSAKGHVVLVSHARDIAVLLGLVQTHGKEFDPSYLGQASSVEPGGRLIIQPDWSYEIQSAPEHDVVPPASSVHKVSVVGLDLAIDTGKGK